MKLRDFSIFEVNSVNPKLNIAIVGATGALGAYIAKQFTEFKHHNVSAVGRKDSLSLKRLHEQGLIIECTKEAKKQTVKIPKEAFCYIGDLEHFPKSFIQNIVIICIKQYDMTEKVASQIRAITNKNSTIAIITNGLPFYFLNGNSPVGNILNTIDPQGKIVETFSERTIIGIQLLIAADVNNNGIVQIKRPLEMINAKLGEPKSLGVSKCLQNFACILKNAQITAMAVSYEELQISILEKQQFTLSVNVLSALLEKNLGEVFDGAQTQPMLRYAVNFMNQIAIALKLKPLRSYEQLKKTPITRDHYSSMCNDLREGKRLEISVIDATLELHELLQNKKLFTAELSDKPLQLMKQLLIQKVNNKVNFQSTPIDDYGLLFKSCENALNYEKCEQDESRSYKLKARL